jgi:predicted metal-dependent phosphoesterase TrpH
MIRSVGGIAVMAHPMEVDNRENLLPELCNAGLGGIEVFYGYYTDKQVKYLVQLSKKWNLIPCGGSDYHALGTPGEPEPGQVGPPMQSVEALLKLAPATKL